MAEAMEHLAERVRARRSLPSPDERRALRLGAGASLRDVGDVCGVSGQAAYQWERGVFQPRGQHLTLYAACLDLFREASDD
jgi:transcriptional regulator with XRE-family HTH domain